MLLTAHQTSFLPWLGFFHKLAVSDVYVILDNVQFEKNSFSNRNAVRSAESRVWLTIPLLTKGHTGRTLREMKINNTEKWRKKHWNTIRQAYGRARWFDRYGGFFEDMYSREWEYLQDIADHSLDFFLKEMKIDKKLIKQSDTGISSNKLDLIADLCRKFDASHFLFGSEGRNYVDEKRFSDMGIVPVFQEYKHPVYEQMKRSDGAFMSHLSIVDLFFNIGADDALELILSNNPTHDDYLGMTNGNK